MRSRGLLKESDMQWVTRQHLKIGRLACPWLIRRFIDHDSEFLFVPPAQVGRVAADTGAIPFDVPDFELWHGSRGSCFDTLRTKYGLEDAALRHIAAILRAADSDTVTQAPEAAGLRAILLGLVRNIHDDHERVAQGLVLCDALYGWAQGVQLQISGRPERGFALWLARWRERRDLASLDLEMLYDIGLSPTDVQIECAKPFWRN
jgi:uncharacterized protein YjiS (DUF1127 family)